MFAKFQLFLGMAYITDILIVDAGSKVKKGGKYQKSIHLSITPDPGYQMGK